jgi:putative hydroxymethylpyrimidine transport system substrate-binding protein
VGVTGAPADEAVLRAVVEGDGGDYDRVRRTTIGFTAVPSLIAKRVDAAVAFWNAEGVALRELGVRTREFRVGDETGEPFPELLVVASRELVDQEPDLIAAVQSGIERGYALATDDPGAAVDNLLSAQPGLEPDVIEAQMEALTDADAFSAGVEPGAVEARRIANWREFAGR